MRRRTLVGGRGDDESMTEDLVGIERLQFDDNRTRPGGGFANGEEVKGTTGEGQANRVHQNFWVERKWRGKAIAVEQGCS